MLVLCGFPDDRVHGIEIRRQRLTAASLLRCGAAGSRKTVKYFPRAVILVEKKYSPGAVILVGTKYFPSAVILVGTIYFPRAAILVGTKYFPRAAILVWKN